MRFSQSDQQRIFAALAGLGVPGKCPTCTPGSLALFPDSYLLGKQDEITSGMVIAALGCQSCGFVRFHSLYQLGLTDLVK